MKKESNAFALDSFFHITLLILKITKGQCKKLRGKFINCYLCFQIHSLWS